jgi:hypothetical protein
MTVNYRKGSRGPYVTEIQNALNANLSPSAGLVPDGIFGSLTDAAVRKFQQQEGLVVDGIVGTNTIAALMVSREAYPPILHRVNFIPQPTAVTCWAAATAMMKNSTVNAIRARTPADMIGSSGGLKNYSGKADHISGSERYASIHGLRYHPPQSHPASAFRNIVQFSPVMLNMLWNSSTYAAGSGSPGHMVVVVGVRGDNDPSGRGTILTIYDPWPVGRGNRETVSYFDKSRNTPLFTYGMFTR